MPTVTATSTENLWRTLRGCENTFRYYADIIGGLIAALPERERTLVTGLDSSDVALVDPLSWPRPEPGPGPCPPCCEVNGETFPQRMQEVSRRIEALTRVMNRLVEQIRQSGQSLPTHLYGGASPGCFPRGDR
jgi:hypothetical protein